MARRVDQVEHVVLAVRAPVVAAAPQFALIVMPRSRSRSIVSSTCSRMSRSLDRTGALEQAIGQRRLAVVDVGDDGEVADARRVDHEDPIRESGETALYRKSPAAAILPPFPSNPEVRFAWPISSRKSSAIVRTRCATSATRRSAPS